MLIEISQHSAHVPIFALFCGVNKIECYGWELGLGLVETVHSRLIAVVQPRPTCACLILLRKACCT